MRYLALASDYDGTIATEGHVPAEVIRALERVAASGRKLILVTGRELDQLIEVFPELAVFDLVVAENGALLYEPKSKRETMLAEPPPKVLIEGLKARGVDDISIGRSIVATWAPHETTVLEVIRELGIEWHIIFNKGAVMVLPSTVNKASGLAAALDQLGLSAHNLVGIGDAENDQAFLRMCECGVAVSNALPSVKDAVDLVTPSDHGAGVVELIERLLEDDLQSVSRSGRYATALGWDIATGEPHTVPTFASCVLFTGSSGGGKSTAATGFMERLAEAGYQYCIIDPEGDYEQFLDAIVLGGKDHAPTAAEVLDVLRAPDRDLVVNLLGVPLHDRPSFFAQLLPQLQELRSKTGRPHWIMIDEAHHLLPAHWEPAATTVPQGLEGMIYLTVHPDLMAKPALACVNVVIALGQSPEKSLETFAAMTGRAIASVPSTAPLASGHAVVWDDRLGAESRHIKVQFGTQARKRHTRKYAEGDLGPERSFYFRGAEGKLNLQAQNLLLFSQIGEGVDVETWQYHLENHHYSTWFRDVIKDSSLAAQAKAIESAGLPPELSRRRLREAIEQDYTLPASRASGWQSDEADHQTKL